MQEQEQPPTFPSAQINITENGMIIAFLLAPGLTLQQAIDETNMNTIVARWLETRRELKKNMEVVRDIKRSDVQVRKARS